MSNTKRSFKDKWKYNEQIGFKNMLTEGSDAQSWILGRNGWRSNSELKKYLKDKKSILDAGCGNGRVTAFLRLNSNPLSTRIIGIDLVSSSIAKKNLANFDNIKIFKKDLLGNLKKLGTFDFIYCQEVLHHTSDPFKAFKNLTTILQPNGEIAIYVYKKKAPIREFTDDYIRTKISKLKYAEAMKVCHEITKFGNSLAKENIKIKVPRLQMLDIPEGTYDLQRFVYHFFMKCFWNDQLSFNDNSVINYDWYHPQNCTRHTENEVKGWFRKLDLSIMHVYTDFYGITIRGRKDI